MRFHLSEEQRAIQENLRAALRDHLTSGRLHALIDGEDEYDTQSWRVVMELGLGGLHLPEADGGSGFSVLEAALATEVLGAAGFSGPAIGHLATGYALSLAPQSAERDRLLADLASGARLATLALPAGWTPERWQWLPSDGRLNGRVEHVIGGLRADLYLVGLTGKKVGLVERGDWVKANAMASTDRTRRLAVVDLEAAPVWPLDVDADRVFDAALVLLAADSLGGAQRALDMSRAYAMERQQFGRPIAQFQAVKHQLADMAVTVDSARSLVWYAALALRDDQPERSRLAALAKAHLGMPSRL